MKLPTDNTCCPDINIEDVVLSNRIGEAAENAEYIWFDSFQGFGRSRLRVPSFRVLGFRVRRLGSLKALPLGRCFSMLKDNAQTPLKLSCNT